jgi:hypothetical protein
MNKHLVSISKKICVSDNGNLTEHIIQNIFLNTLMKAGFYVQKEVVMPVLVDNMFVGHNRFDIMITEKKNKITTINILEIKTLSQSISNSKTKQRIFEQCLGYRNCVKSLFKTSSTKINVFLINIWKKKSEHDIMTSYSYDVVDISKLKWHKECTIPQPIVRNKEEYFEIEEILKSKQSKSKQTRVLVKWVGVEVPSWEPLSNIPSLVKNRYKAVINAPSVHKL